MRPRTSRPPRPVIHAYRVDHSPNTLSTSEYRRDHPLRIRRLGHEYRRDHPIHKAAPRRPPTEYGRDHRITLPFNPPVKRPPPRRGEPSGRLRHPATWNGGRRRCNSGHTGPTDSRLSDNSGDTPIEGRWRGPPELATGTDARFTSAAPSRHACQAHPGLRSEPTTAPDPPPSSDPPAPVGRRRDRVVPPRPADRRAKRTGERDGARAARANPEPQTLRPPDPMRRAATRRVCPLSPDSASP